MPHRFVVLAERIRGFDSRAEADSFARANVPAIICERQIQPNGSSLLVELARHDWLWDAARREWRVMLAPSGA